MKPLKYFLFFLFLFIVMQCYCQNSSDSIKYLIVEKSYEKDGKINIKAKQFPEHPNIKVLLKDNTIIKGKISEITDSSITIRKGNIIKISDIKEISTHGSPFLAIAGGIITTAGISILLYSFTHTYLPYLNEGCITVLVGGTIATIGLVVTSIKNNYSVDDGWKIKVITELRSLSSKYN